MSNPVPNDSIHIAVIILAAGASTRFANGHKLTALLDGLPVIKHTVRAVQSSSMSEILVVTGAEHAAISECLRDTRVAVSQCADAARGMAASLAHGIRQISASAAGAAVIPGDMPALTAPFLNQMCEVFRAANGERIVYAATRNGAQRNPVIWPRRYFGMLADLQGAGGAKGLLTAEFEHAIAVQATDDRDLDDIDTVDDLTKLSSLMRGGH